ncbi:MAG: hypothetical protein QXU79_04470 [Candidatus Micrarchaeaceae archaeon]
MKRWGALLLASLLPLALIGCEGNPTPLPPGRPAAPTLSRQAQGRISTQDPARPAPAPPAPALRQGSDRVSTGSTRRLNPAAQPGGSTRRPRAAPGRSRRWTAPASWASTTPWPWMRKAIRISVTGTATSGP